MKLFDLWNMTADIYNHKQVSDHINSVQTEYFRDGQMVTAALLEIGTQLERIAQALEEKE